MSNQKQPQCPVCPNRGFVMRKDFTGRRYKQPCHWCLETPDSLFNQKKDKTNER